MSPPQPPDQDPDENSRPSPDRRPARRPNDHTVQTLFPLLPGETVRPRLLRRPASSGPWINAHCDGGARGNPGPAGFGALITDDAGNTLAELSEFLGIRTNNYAEYAGLLGCLEFALKHQHPRLRVVSDSELMVKQIQGKYQVKSPDLKPLFDEAKRRIAHLEVFEITHALRHKNKAADALANEAMDRGMKRPGSEPRTLPPINHRPKIADLAPPPLKATPYPNRAEAPPAPENFEPPIVPRPGPPPPPVPVIAAAATPEPPPRHTPSPDAMLRGVTRDGKVLILGSATLPDGIFVKIIRE